MMRGRRVLRRKTAVTDAWLSKKLMSIARVTFDIVTWRLPSCLTLVPLNLMSFDSGIFNTFSISAFNLITRVSRRKSFPPHCQ